MREPITRAAALAALRKYNHEPFHIQHALTVEGVMRWYAQQLGYGDEADFWATVGLLHDIDFEQWPEQHCQKAPELLREAGCGDDLIRAVCSHGYGICCDIEPTHQMEKVLYAADELTGLIGAAALMRPSKSCQDMEVKSLKKKYKDKKFAAGCSRDVIQQGADRLGWTLEELMEKTILAMRSCEDSVNAAMETLNENGTYDLLVQKHISNEDVELPELPSYESKGTLTMGTNAEFEPFEYVGDDGETLMGFDIDYAKYLCATMGYDLEIENMDFDALPGALQSGKVDFLAAGISITEEKQQVMDFTNEYYEATQAIVVLK